MRTVSSTPALLTAALCAAVSLPLPAAAFQADCDNIHPAVETFVRPAQPCNGDSVSLVFRTCEPCTEIQGTSRTADGTIHLSVAMRPQACYLSHCDIDSFVVPLGAFVSGEHEQRFVYDVRVIEDSLLCDTSIPGSIRWWVSEICPAPPPGELPYLTNVIIGSNRTAGVLATVCPNDSFPVRLIGEFPSDCVTLAGVELVYLPTFGFAPAPPIVRIKYTSGDCLGRPCIARPVPWEATLWLSGLPRGQYQLPLEAWRVSDVCPVPGDSLLLGRIQRAFHVVDECSTNTAMCLDPSWDVTTLRNDRCDAFVGPDRSGAVTLKLGTGVALAGLEGDLLLQPRGLQITMIEPVGPAADMNIDWRRTETGARFVMFAKEGAPIPGGTLPKDRRVPILRITAELGPQEILAPRTVIRVGQLLGSTIDGGGVPRCPTPTVIEPDDYAVFCRGVPCDFDGNGRADVRDLVRMIRCLNNEGACADSAKARFDCNNDQVFNIDDVFCCARVILRGPHDEPGDGRRDDSIQLALGEPRETGELFEVPIRLSSGTPLGGARVALRFPSDRFEVVTLDAPDASRHSWLMLHEVTGDDLVVGVLALGSAGSPPPMNLTLRLKPGQTAAGSVTLMDAEFSDEEGSALIADLGNVATSLGAGTFDLSPGTPNPFRTALSFSVTLPTDSDLQVGVFDLSGRRVTTLHGGRATAGTHAFQWNGRDANGSQVRGGVYFVRARSEGQLISRKAVFLGGR